MKELMDYKLMLSAVPVPFICVVRAKSLDEAIDKAEKLANDTNWLLLKPIELITYEVRLP